MAFSLSVERNCLLLPVLEARLIHTHSPPSALEATKRLPHSGTHAAPTVADAMMSYYAKRPTVNGRHPGGGHTVGMPSQGRIQIQGEWGGL